MSLSHISRVHGSPGAHSSHGLPAYRECQPTQPFASHLDDVIKYQIILSHSGVHSSLATGPSCDYASEGSQVRRTQKSFYSVWRVQGRADCGESEGSP